MATVTEQWAVSFSTDGFSVVTCEIDDGECVHTGTAKCSPEDTFHEGIGQGIALTRALASFGTQTLQIIRAHTDLQPRTILDPDRITEICRTTWKDDR